MEVAIISDQLIRAGHRVIISLNCSSHRSEKYVTQHEIYYKLQIFKYYRR